MTDDTTTYFDRAEFIQAAADPQYRDSARYRAEVEAKLQRSLSAGTVTPMGEFVDYAQTIETRTAAHTDEGATYGGAVPMPGASAAWVAASYEKISNGTFGGLEELAWAMAAPAFEVDPTYQRAVQEKVARSRRAGTLLDFPVPTA